jgi:stage III sporulation protein AA
MDFFGKFADVCDALPSRLLAEIRRTAASYPDFSRKLSEIRARRGQVASLTVGGRALPLPVVLTGEEIDKTLLLLSEGSLYAHREGLLRGELVLSSGCRVGVVGRAVGEASGALRDASSLVFRIPRRIVGAADGAWEFFTAEEPTRGMLVFSPPGVGKTTLLLDLAVRLSSGARPRSVALLDTRGEFSGMLSGGEGLLDLLVGYSRGEGARIALRSLSPEVIVTDEIGSIEEAAVLADCVNAGVCVIASAHAASVEDLLRRRAPRELIEGGVFSSLYRLSRIGDRVTGEGTRLGGTSA